MCSINSSHLLDGHEGNSRSSSSNLIQNKAESSYQIEYVNPASLLMMRINRSENQQNSVDDDQEEGRTLEEQESEEVAREKLLSLLPMKRVHETADLVTLQNSKGLNRLIVVLMNISNRLSKFGILEFDDQIDYLRSCLNSRTKAIITILDRLDQWITEIPLDKTPQRFGNRAFKVWGNRLKSEAKKLHEEFVLDNSHRPIAAELLHHFENSFGSFGRLDYGTGHELSFLAYLSILHLTRILKNKDLLITGLIIFPKYLNVCKTLQSVYNLEPAGSKGVYGLDDFFHVAYIFGSAQLLYHPTIQPSSILDDKFLSKINQIEAAKSGESFFKTELSTRSIEFMNEYGLKRSPFFECVSRTIELKSRPLQVSKASNGKSSAARSVKPGEVEETGDGSDLSSSSNPTTVSLVDHSPILWNLGAHVKTWAKIHNGLIKMFKGEILSKVPVMQHFWLTDATGVLAWVDLNDSQDQAALDASDDLQKDTDELDPDYLDDYAVVHRKPVQLT